jgi:membrane dipeptidase
MFIFTIERGMDMKVIDTHCDALLKLWENRDLTFGKEDQRLHVSRPEMEQGDVQLQVFAVFVPMNVPPGRRFHAALEMAMLFHEQVVGSGLQPVYGKQDIDEVMNGNRRGAMLFLEGAHPLEGSLTYLQTLYRLGVRGMGLTWNFRTEAADGCEEPRPSGLSLFGRQVIKEMNRLGMMIDVSHLAEPGFWDVMELSESSVIASHSNTMEYCSHKRNLTDEQIRALIKKESVIGLSFVPYFNTSEKRTVWIDDLLRHLDHVCSLGGADHVGFGSDFDGIDKTFGDLSSAGKYQLLVEELLKRYSEAEVRKFMYENWLRVFKSVLQ